VANHDPEVRCRGKVKCHLVYVYIRPDLWIGNYHWSLRILQCVVGNLTSHWDVKLHVTHHDIPRRPESSISTLWTPHILLIIRLFNVIEYILTLPGTAFCCWLNTFENIL
jgi:hypothetical protein